MDNSTANTSKLTVLQETQSLYAIVYVPKPVTTAEIILMSTLFPVIFIFYCVILVLLTRKGSEFRNSYYTLAIGLGFNDIAMLIYQVYRFVWDLYGYSYLGNAMENVMYFIFGSTCGWYSTQLYSLIIAVNRFVAVMFFDFYRRHASVKSSLVLIIAILIISLCWTTPLLVICGYRYVPYYKSHMPDIFGSEKCFFYGLNIYEPFDKAFPYFVAGCCFLLYTVAALYSACKRKSFATSAIQASYTREIKLLIQGFILTIALCSVDIIHWNDSPALLECTGDWVYCSLNPLVYIALDKRLRMNLINTGSTLTSSVGKIFSPSNVSPA